MLYVPLIILIVIAAVLLCFIVLIQNSKGGGLSSGFASSNQIMGVRKTTDFLEKATWGLAAFIVVLSVVTSYVVPKAGDSDNTDLIQEAQKSKETNPLNTPAGFATPTKSQNAAPAAGNTQQGANNGASKQAPASK